jgi:hypothetical protein
MKHHWLAFGLVVALSGCDRFSGSNGAICSTPETFPAGIKLPPVERSKWCVHRWAYKLAQSDEAVGIVADAAVGACLESLEASQVALGAFQAGRGAQPGEEAAADAPWLQFRRAGRGIQQGEEVASGGSGQGFSRFSGRNIGIAAQAYEELRAEALFRVVQARAGKCSPDV